jgi:hypothetical protein
MLLSSWFCRTRAKKEMRIGSKNEDAALMSFSLVDITTDVFQCRLFESKAFCQSNGLFTLSHRLVHRT